MHLSYNRFNGASFAKQLHVQRECSSVNITNKETVRVKLRTIMQEDVNNITCESESSIIEAKGIELRYIYCTIQSSDRYIYRRGRSVSASGSAPSLHRS